MAKDFMDAMERSDLLRKGSRGLLSFLFSRSFVILLALLVQVVLVLVFLFPFFEYLSILMGGSAVLAMAAVVFILNTRDDPTVKLSWCAVIAVLPVFGVLLYAFCRHDIGYQVEQKLVQDAMELGAAYAPDRRLLMESIRREDQNLYNLAHYLENHGRHGVYANTQVVYFPLGEDKFHRMLEELEKAEKFIFMEYFAIGPSTMWDEILEILLRKVKEGVEVRVMYDGSCAVTLLPYQYPKQLEKLGIRCKMCSPFRPFVSTHYNNRDHRKILVIDGHTAFTGGVNIQDRYINRKQVYGHWKDTAVMLRGEAAYGFTLMFLQMWNATERERIYTPYLTPPRGVAEPGYVIPYGDSPLDGERTGEMVYLNMLNQARDYCYIMTPYLILDGEMTTALEFAAKRGVDVRLILPHIPDKPYAFVLAQSHYEELLEAGVKIYEYTPGFVHAKVFLCDDREAVVGTVNLDYRSLYLHFECAAYLYRVPALEDIKKDFVETMEKSHLVTLAEARQRPLASKIAGVLLKLIAPLM